MYTFKTQVSLEVETRDALVKVELEWELEPEFRSWGIKGFSVRFPAQKIHYLIEGDDGEEIQQTLEISEPPKVEFTGSSETRWLPGIAPERIEIWKGKVTIYF